MYFLSLWHSSTISISPINSLIVAIGFVNKFLDKRAAEAVAMYFRPAQINLVDRDEVSEAKSPRSIQATFNPLAAASKAIPAPVAPPPITRRSKTVSSF
jgi:hypothetical protein